MKPDVVLALPKFLEVLGLTEEPLGVFYTDHKPAVGSTPEPMELPTREREARNEVDWSAVFGGVSCVIGHIWRARRKKTAAFFEAERYGCPGGAFFLGFLKPQSWAVIHYVSTGSPGRMEGERYIDSPQALDRIFAQLDPRLAPRRYCVFKPLSQFGPDEEPELVAFFCRPESLAGLHQLVCFVTNDPEAVVSPWGAACTGLVSWPLHYLARGQLKAVLGGWDPSARRFFKTDELSLSLPWVLFQAMLRRWPESFLATHAWEGSRQKIARSAKAWGEVAPGEPGGEPRG